MHSWRPDRSSAEACAWGNTSTHTAPQQTSSPSETAENTVPGCRKLLQKCYEGWFCSVKTSPCSGQPRWRSLRPCGGTGCPASSALLSGTCELLLVCVCSQGGTRYSASLKTARTLLQSFAAVNKSFESDIDAHTKRTDWEHEDGFWLNSYAVRVKYEHQMNQRYLN